MDFDEATNHIITTTRNVGVGMGQITACYMLTRPDIIVPEAMFHNLVDDDKKQDLIDRLNKYGVPVVSGKALFSSLLNQNFYYRESRRDYHEDITIYDGILISGTIRRDSLYQIIKLQNLDLIQLNRITETWLKFIYSPHVNVEAAKRM